MKNNTIGEILRNARKATSPAIDLATIKDYINEKMHRDQNGRLAHNSKPAEPAEPTEEEKNRAYAEYIRSMRAEDAGLWDTRGE